MIYIENEVVYIEEMIETMSQTVYVKKALGDETKFKYDEDGKIIETKKFNIDIGDWEVI